MPRVFAPDMLDDEAAEEAWDADEPWDPEKDPFAAPPDAFQYLPAPEMGGPKGPVYVAVRPDQAGRSRKRRGVWPFGGGSERPREEWEIRVRRVSAALAAALADLGAARAYCRYDGGNDEGFAWFDHCIFKDGSVRGADRLARDLEAAGAAEALRELGFDGGHLGRRPVRDALDDCVASAWSVELLGRGFGTGEYVMYGAFSVDLETGLVADDPSPDPVVQNIFLKKG